MLLDNQQSEVLSHYLPSFVLSPIKPDSSCFIHRLPFDVFIDHIFVLLCVEDVLSLRRVNKAFFLITHEPIIWKRFLAQIPFPIPPIRPTFRYASHDTDFEIEQLVSRSISLEDNWRKRHPQATSSTLFDTHYRVLDMKLLPGGKYLVASVRDEFRCFIVVYCLDHPEGPRALARMPTEVKAYNLQAKYMSFRGKPVIMIAYIRRSFVPGGPTNVDVSEYGSRNPIDPCYPVVNELICVATDLGLLEQLSDPRYSLGDPELAQVAFRYGTRGAFTQVASAVAQRPVESVSLYDLNGKPHVIMVQSPNRIVSVDLTAQAISWLVCTKHQDYELSPHDIRAVRPLPFQNELLVFRTIQLEPASDGKILPALYMQVLEIYDHPAAGGRFADPKNVYVLGHQEVAAVHISDYGVPTTTEDTYRLKFDYAPSPPISVYMETKNPSGVVHEVLWPTCEENERGDKRYFYNLDYVCYQTRHDSQPRVAHVLPGAYRSFIYTAMDDDRKDALTLVSLRRYINPEYQTKDYPIPRIDRSCHVLRSKVREMPPNAYATLDGCSTAIEHYRENGVGAITWDEGVGRVCIADGKTSHIEIVEFANVVHLDRRVRD